MDDRCLLDVIGDPDALTSFLDKPDVFGQFDASDLEFASSFQNLQASQYAPAVNSGGILHQETPSSVLMRLENISPPPIRNDTVLGHMGDRPFTPTSPRQRVAAQTAAGRPIIDLGFGDQEGGEIKEIFPDFLAGSVSAQPSGNQEGAAVANNDLFQKVQTVPSRGGASQENPASKDMFAGIFSFEDENAKITRAVPSSSLNTGNVHDVIQQSLMLSGVGDLANDSSEQSEAVQIGQGFNSSISQHGPRVSRSEPPNPQPSPASSHTLPLSSSSAVQPQTVTASAAAESQRVGSKSIPQVAVVRPQTQPQPQPQPQTQVLGSQGIGSQGQVINSQYLQSPTKVMVSGQQAVMPMQQTYVLNAKGPINIHPKSDVNTPAPKAPAPQPQGIRIMLAPQTGGNIATIAGNQAGGTIQLNQGQGAPGQQTVVLHNVQGGVPSASASSVPVLQPVITIGATQGSLIFMTRPTATTVLAPQQIQQLQTTGSGLAAIQMTGQPMGSVVQPGAIAVNQQQAGKQTLPVVQFVQSGVPSGKTIQTITLPQGYVAGGQTIVIQNPQGATNVLPIAQSQGRIVQSGTNQMNFVQTQPTAMYGKVQATPQLIQPKIVGTTQSHTKGVTLPTQTNASASVRTKDISPSPVSRQDNTISVSQFHPSNMPNQQGTVIYTSGNSVGQQPMRQAQSYIHSVGQDENQAAKKDAKQSATFHHKLYGTISTVQAEEKTQSAEQAGLLANEAITVSSQSSSTPQTILQKVHIQPQTVTSGYLTVSQYSQSQRGKQGRDVKAQGVYSDQRFPPATVVTPSNVNAKGLPEQMQSLPGNNGSVPASVHHPPLTSQSEVHPVSSSQQLTKSTSQSASYVPNKPKWGSQLKKQNMFGSQGGRQAGVVVTCANSFQGQFVKSVQAKTGQTFASSSSLVTTASSSIVTTTVHSTTNQHQKLDVKPSELELVSSAQSVILATKEHQQDSSRSGDMRLTMSMPQTGTLRNAPQVKQESGLNQPMVSALQLKVQMASSQGIASGQQQQQHRPNQPMISALQLKEAGHFQTQGGSTSNLSKSQPMMSALELKQQMQRQQLGMNVPAGQPRPMVSALQVKQIQRQGNPSSAQNESVARMNQLLQLQQRQSAAQAVANHAQAQALAKQVQAQALASQSQAQPLTSPVHVHVLPSQSPVGRPPSVGPPLQSPQGRPPSRSQPTPSPQGSQIARPPSAGQPIASPQSVHVQRPPSVNQPLASPQGIPPHRPPSAGHPLPSPQGRHTPGPPSVGHPMPSPQGTFSQPVASPQGSVLPLSSPQAMSTQMMPNSEGLIGTSGQVLQRPDAMYTPTAQPAQNVTNQQMMGRPVQNVPSAAPGTLQTSHAMMPQLLQAFEILKGAQNAQAKGPAGAQEQARYMQEFQHLLKKYPDLLKQLQNLKERQQLEKQQKQQQMASSLPTAAFQQVSQGSSTAQFLQQQKQQQMASSMPTASFQQVSQGSATAQFSQPRGGLSSSADQAQLVASSILQATRGVGAATEVRPSNIPTSASQKVPPPFFKSGANPQVRMIAPGATTSQAPPQYRANPSVSQSMNPNYTPNVTIQAGNVLREGLPSNIVPHIAPQQGKTLPAITPGRRKTPPAGAMPPPPPPTQQQPPPNVSILPSQKQAPLGAVPSVTKEKDVFEFDDDDPAPPTLDKKFSVKPVVNKTASGTVHHQPFSVQQSTPGQAPLKLTQPSPIRPSIQPSSSPQAPFTGQATSQANPVPGPSNVQPQASQLSRLIQEKPLLPAPAFQMDQAQSQKFQLGQTQAPGQVYRQIAAATPQPVHVPASQGAQMTSPGQPIHMATPGVQSMQMSSSGTQPTQMSAPAGQGPQLSSSLSQMLASGSPSAQMLKTEQRKQQAATAGIQSHQTGTASQDVNVASKRLQQLQSQQAGASFKAKQKRAHQISVAAKQKLQSVQGFINQLQGIASRTPKQDAMLQQMKDLQQKITQQVKEELDSLIKQAPPAAKSVVPTPVAAGTPSTIPPQNRPVSVASTLASVQPTAATSSSYQQSIAASNIPSPTGHIESQAGGATLAPSTDQPKPSNLIQQLNAPSSTQDTAPTSNPMAPPAYQPTTQAAPAVGTSAPAVGQAAPGTSANATPLQLFTTNIVQLVGKNLNINQQNALKRLQDQLKNMTPQQQQEFYRHNLAKIQHKQAAKQTAESSSSAVQPAQLPSSSTQQAPPAPQVQTSSPLQAPAKPQLSPVRTAKLTRSKAKKKGAKPSPKGASEGGKDVEIIATAPPPPPPRIPTPPPAAADFIKERRGMDIQLVENINFKTPFASYAEAVQRLLPYHIAHEKIPSKETFEETATSFEEISSNLLEKKQKMVDKLQLLVYQDSMQKEPSSEMVMLERLFLQDERAALAEHKKRAEANTDLVESPMPKTDPTQGTRSTPSQVTPTEAAPTHTFAQPNKVSAVKAESRQKTNHDRIRKADDSDSHAPHKKAAFTDGNSTRKQTIPAGKPESKSILSVESQYHSAIVSKYPSSDEEDHAGKKSSIRLRLTKSLLAESNVRSRDARSESDESVLSSPTKPKRRKSRLEALLSSDSTDTDLMSPSFDHRTRSGVWTVSDRSRDSFSFQDADASTRDTIFSQSELLDDEDEFGDGKDVLQEQMDCAINSILFLQNPTTGNASTSDEGRHQSLADITFDPCSDDVFDSADDSAVFNVDDYANASFLEENSAVAGLETELTSMESDVDEAVRSIL